MCKIAIIHCPIDWFMEKWLFFSKTKIVSVFFLTLLFISLIWINVWNFWFFFLSEIWFQCYQVQEWTAIFHDFLPMAIMHIPHIQMKKYLAHKLTYWHTFDTKLAKEFHLKKKQIKSNESQNFTKHKKKTHSFVWCKMFKFSSVISFIKNNRIAFIFHVIFYFYFF